MNASGRESYKSDRSFSRQFMASRPAIFAPAQPAREEIPSFGVEAVIVKKKMTYVLRQLDGSLATLSICICDRSEGGGNGLSY